MGTAGSGAARTTIPATIAVGAVFVGWLAMTAALRAALPLGLHAALLVSEACLVAPGLLALAAAGAPWRRALALGPIPAPATALALVLGGALWAASLGLFELQQAAWPPPPGFLEAWKALHEMLRPHGLLEALWSIAVIALVPAACEELLFRGIALPALARVLRPAAAVAASAALFGLIHVEVSLRPPDFNAYRLPFAAAVGLGLGALRLRAGSLVPCILAHACLNTTTFLVVLFSGQQDVNASPDLLLGAALLAGGGAAAAWLLVRFPRAGAAAGAS